MDHLKKLFISALTLIVEAFSALKAHDIAYTKMAIYAFKSSVSRFFHLEVAPSIVGFSNLK